MVPGKKRRRQRCRFCGELFHPDPRLKGKQYACSAPQCQLERKRAKQRQSCIEDAYACFSRAWKRRYTSRDIAASDRGVAL